ncbi:cystathionine gamma-synthase protein [Colletotrichum truncatum]|uniref:Cystathionine gamma-synthase protein n=1 Tax=Colletotrichum truncatum TaxID=5467 RepID=A0ACC3YXJ5_COLTU|nr:cystathionine gamma-synthase protein [Colletotrichum truncatum]KAF6791016.1 cystathionine gamma-synthase protein [Colletotrichum truncatum]
MTPYFDVSHLPSSASFYSAILQPLGIHYISTNTLTANDDKDPNTANNTARSLSTVTYGTSSPPTPVFQIREARNSLEPLKLSRVVFSAPSPTAVTDFHFFALRANPAPLAVPRPTAITQCGDIHRAAVTDMDGNTMEVVYQPPPNYPPSHAGSTVRRTQSTHEEVSRILNWNHDVATSESSPSTLALAMASRTGQLPGNEPYTILRRSVTTSIIESHSTNNDLDSAPIPSPAAAPNSSSGLQTSTVVGSLLGAAVGAAAGAALTYGMMRKERAPAPLHEFDGTNPAPPFQRRATFPDQYQNPQATPGRYVEVERTVEKIRYPEAYPTLPDNGPAPEYMAKYSQVGSQTREVDVYDDTRSHHSSRYQLERGSSVHSRSQAAVPRAAPLMITDYEHRSNVGSRISIAGKSAVPRSVTQDFDETRTYVSARSAKSQSTIRPPPPTTQTELGARSKAPSVVPSRAPTNAPSRAPTVAPSRAPTKAPSHAPTYVPSKAPSKTHTAIRVPNSNPVFAYPPATRAPTYISARNVAAPKSGIGSSSRADWEEDAISVAPSDSISCIGSKTSRRHYH